MFEELRAKIAKEMEKERPRLQQLRLDATLLKMELRDKSEDVAEDLQGAFDAADNALERLSGATAEKGEELRERAIKTWGACKAKLHDVLKRE